jgi:hypothetical protein
LTFKFNKSAELFVGMHDKAFSVAAVRVSNEDRSRLGNQYASRTRTDCTSKGHTQKSLTIALEPTAGRCDDND